MSSFEQKPAQRPQGRAADAPRPCRLTLGELKFAEGSALIELGDTRVLAAASVDGKVPSFLAGTGRGWVTAEYAMLPRATSTRNAREVAKGRPSGRTSEIQRLIGRSLRAVVDLAALGEHNVTVDCDVLQADGGTRTAAVTAGYAALAQAMARLLLTGEIARWPLLEPVAAVSVGVVRGVAVLDLEYSEDQEAAVDMNVVATASGKLVEVQGTGESRSFTRAELDAMIDLAMSGIERLIALQRDALAPIMAEVEQALAGRARERRGPKSEKELWGRP